LIRSMVWDTAFGKLHQNECRHERSTGPMSAYQRGSLEIPQFAPKKIPGRRLYVGNCPSSEI
jgi:hypothetical protein